MSKESIIIQYLKLVEKLSGRYDNPCRSGWKYKTLERLLIEHGVHFTANTGKLPEDLRKGKLGYCFSNCCNAAWNSTNNKYVYCEGFATSYGLPINHAWVTHDGQSAIELTWRGLEDRNGPVEYFGVPFSFTFTAEVALKAGYYGMFQPRKDPHFEMLLEWLRLGFPEGAIQKEFNRG